MQVNLMLCSGSLLLVRRNSKMCFRCMVSAVGPVFTAHFLKCVAEVKASGLPHMLNCGMV